MTQSTSQTRHRWILADDLKILFIYLYQVENTDFATLEEFAASIPDEVSSVSVSQVKARIDEFSGLDGSSNRFSHPCYQTAFVFNEYRNLSMEGLKKIAFNYTEKVKRVD